MSVAMNLLADSEDAGVAFVGLGVEAGLAREGAQRAFGGFAGHLPLAVFLGDVGVVGDRDDLDHRVQVAVVVQAGGLALEGDLALWLIAGAADVVSAAAGDDVACGHLVLRECAGLVGADHGDGTECLDRGELAGDGVAMGHALHAERET